jgi:hypothetical protein
MDGLQSQNVNGQGVLHRERERRISGIRHLRIALALRLSEAQSFGGALPEWDQFCWEDARVNTQRQAIVSTTPPSTRNAAPVVAEACSELT